MIEKLKLPILMHLVFILISKAPCCQGAFFCISGSSALSFRLSLLFLQRFEEADFFAHDLDAGLLFTVGAFPPVLP
jgi:hypothetical protein